VARLSWRFIYYITSGAGIFAWIALIFLVPETRWMRSADELGTSPLPLSSPPSY
jgi:predicted MFS family arabinose efflux permease